QDVDRLVVVNPRHAVRGEAVQPAVALQHTERAPALVDVGRRLVLEAADVVAPEAEAGQAERQAAAKTLGHRFVGRHIVAAPMDGKALGADGRRTGEYDGLTIALEPLQRLEDEPVVKE